MIHLDQTADTFPVGMAGTPFEDVYRALRIVAASVWAVDPTVYRAGMAWGWYALHAPEILVGFRDVVTAALVSAVAPMVSDTQTDGELVEYLRQWRSYTPTGPKLEAILALFGIDAEVRAISDPEGQALLPVQDTRLAFYIFVKDMDWARPMWLGDIAELARRATPLGSRPYIVYYVEPTLFATASPAPAELSLWVDGDPIGLPPSVDVRLWLDSQQDPRTFSAGGYLGAFADGTDAQVLALYGVPLGEGTMKKVLAGAWGHFLFLPIAMTDYQGVELTSPPIADLYCEPAPADAPASLTGSVVVRSLSAYPLPDDPYYYDLYMWTCRLVPATSDVQHAYYYGSTANVRTLSAGGGTYTGWRTGPSSSAPIANLSSDASHFVTRVYSSSSDSVGFCAARVLLTRYGGDGTGKDRACLTNGGPVSISVNRFDFIAAPLRAYSYVIFTRDNAFYCRVTLDRRFSGRAYVILVRRSGVTAAYSFVGVVQCIDGVFEAPCGGSNGVITVYVF